MHHDFLEQGDLASREESADGDDERGFDNWLRLLTFRTGNNNRANGDSEVEDGAEADAPPACQLTHKEKPHALPLLLPRRRPVPEHLG